jgi:hypothetical protein
VFERYQNEILQVDGPKRNLDSLPEIGGVRSTRSRCPKNFPDTDLKIRQQFLSGALGSSPHNFIEMPIRIYTGVTCYKKLRLQPPA